MSELQKKVTAENAKRRLIATSEARAVITRYDDEAVWDSLMAKDLDPELIAWVQDRFEKGWHGPEIANALGLRGTACKQWKKILAYFRAGMRGDAEVYLYRESHKLFQVIEKARQVLEDAFENGTPLVGWDKEGNPTQIRVKGATKELAGFVEAYAKAMERPVKLWKEFGAIGEKTDGRGPGGITIVVKTNVPRPSQAEVDQYRDKLKELPVIEVKSVDQPKK